MPKGAFGENLRREREMRGVTLEEISSATCISTRFLEALETEQWDRLPGGVFNRGFIRAVARFLGLDQDALVAEYALATNDRPEVAVWSDNPPRTPPVAQIRTLPWLLALLLVAIVVGSWFAYQEFAPSRAAWRAPVPEVPKASSPPAQSPVATPAAGTAGQSSASPGTAAAAAEPALLELKIDAANSTVVTVIADGKTLFDGRMNAGENRRFQAKYRFEVSARNSLGVLLEMNGQTMPPLGTPGEPGTLLLTRKDLKKQTGGQD